jgi:4-carboxymuconolactone decarboxylase
MGNERLEHGKQVLARIDPNAAQALEGAFNDIAPDLGRLILEYAWGDIYSRPGLDLRSREIATMAALVARGGVDGQLRAHIRYALNAGCSRQEVIEVMLHLSVFAGIPAAISGIVNAREVFALLDGGK